MDLFMVFGPALKLVFLFIALGALGVFLRRLDRRAGVDFKEFYRDLKNDPKAAAHYLGCRFVGACVLVGLALF